MSIDLSLLRVVAKGLDHPEGVNTAADGSLVAGGEAGQVYRVDPEAGIATTLATTGGFVLGVATDAAGDVFACDWGAMSVVRVTPGGEVGTYCDSVAGTPFTCPNYCAFDADGWLWVSDSGDDRATEPQGRLVRIPPGGGEGEPLDLPPMYYPNGIAFDRDGALYVIETFIRPRVSVLRDGNLSVFAPLPATVPDGIALAAGGAVYVSCYQPNVVLRLAGPGAEPEVVLEDWTGVYMMSPTNISFFGADLRELAIASLHGWDIKAVTLDEPGQQIFHPEVP
jgi:gluconolactonase